MSANIRISQPIAHELYEICQYSSQTKGFSSYIDSLLKQVPNKDEKILLDSQKIEPFYGDILSARLHSTPLLNYLIDNREYPLVKGLIKKASILQLNQLGKDGTPLHYACAKNAYTISKLLLEHKADPSRKHAGPSPAEV